MAAPVNPPNQLPPPPPLPPLQLADLRHWTSWEEFDAANYFIPAFYNTIPQNVVHIEQSRLVLLNKFRRIQGPDIEYICRRYFHNRYAPTYLAIVEGMRWVVKDRGVQGWNDAQLRNYNFWPLINTGDGTERPLRLGKIVGRANIRINAELDPELAKEIEWVANLNRRQQMLGGNVNPDLRIPE